MDTTVDHFTPLSLRVRGNWRASEASETLSGLFNIENRGYILLLYTRKMVPITGGARSFLLVFKNKIERRGRQNKNNRPINLLNGITFSTYFKYTTQS